MSAHINFFLLLTSYMYCVHAHSLSYNKILSNPDQRDEKKTVLLNVIVKSALDCAGFCGKTLYCWSYLFHHINKTCVARSSIYGNNMGSREIEIRYSFYTKSGTPKRMKPSTCDEIRKCSNGSIDREYWLYPRNFQGQRARIYCHGMNTSQPEEFLTLMKRNWGEYPNLEIIRPYIFCREKVGVPNLENVSGERRFWKIKIDIQTLTVYTTVRTFASGPQVMYGFGTARDCYKGHYSHSFKDLCGVKGTFTIDLTGTGFSLDRQQKWKPVGFHPFMHVERVSDEVVKLKCGGHCGGCEPDGPLVLKIKTDQELSNDSATFVECPN